MSFDVTFCIAECANIECELHKSNIRKAAIYKGFVSVADRHDGCRRYRPAKGCDNDARNLISREKQ